MSTPPVAVLIFPLLLFVFFLFLWLVAYSVLVVEQCGILALGGLDLCTWFSGK